MTRHTKAAFIFLLATPLLLGAGASKQQGDQQVVVPSRGATKGETDVQVQPMSTVQPTTLDAPSQDAMVSLPEASAGASTYSIDWYSINGGGTVNATSTNYQMGASIGQAVAGAASSPNYQMGIGFWYGAGSGGCACDCHGDPSPLGACDGMQTVTDVSQVINVAFRGAAAILDPNGNCPYQTTDVNCSGQTEIVDVTKMVNVAFRGANVATEFCNPCP